mgnify:CR=1 FL=1
MQFFSFPKKSIIFPIKRGSGPSPKSIKQLKVKTIVIAGYVQQPKALCWFYGWTYCKKALKLDQINTNHITYFLQRLAKIHQERTCLGYACCPIHLCSGGISLIWEVQGPYELRKLFIFLFMGKFGKFANL